MAQTGILQETLQEVIGETMKLQETTSKDTTETNVNADETNSGETSEKEYIGGIDISDVPEQDRPRIKELLSKKVSMVEKGAQAKFKEIAKYKQEKDAILAQGLTEDEAANALRNYIEQKRNVNQTTSQTKKEAVKSLDKMISEAPYEQREALTNLRTIIKEEGNTETIDKLLAKVEKLEAQVGYFNQNSSDARAIQVNSTLDDLSKDFGKDFIDKHREQVVLESVKYPKADPEQILNAISNPKELREAILSNQNKGKKAITNEKLNAITSSGSGINGSSEKIDVHKTSYKDLFRNVLKK